MIDDVSNLAFRAFLKRRGACKKGLNWLGKRSFVQAWEKCKNTGRMLWLVEQLLHPPHTENQCSFCALFEKSPAAVRRAVPTAKMVVALQRAQRCICP